MKSGIVYQISCQDCTASYIGQTGRNLSQRITEHRRAVKKTDTFSSAMSEHVCQTALCLIDDILVYAKTQEEHDIRLDAVLKWIKKSGVTLNPEKCEFSKSSLTILGHLVDKHGVHPDPQKTDAISNMKPPKNVTELRRFLGMINQLGKFTP